MNAFFLGLTLVLGAPEEKDTPTLNASIIGEWRVESVTANGRPRNDYVGTKYIFGWNGRWAKVIASDGKKPTTCIQLRYELVPADPFAIDLNPPGDFGSFGPRSVAIFKVEGDTLLICERSVRWGTEPPLKFESPRRFEGNSICSQTSEAEAGSDGTNTGWLGYCRRSSVPDDSSALPRSGHRRRVGHGVGESWWAGVFELARQTVLPVHLRWSLVRWRL